MPTFKIIDIREIPSGEVERLGKFDTLITYQLDAFRTYVTKIPKEQFNEAKLKEVVAKEMAERGQWIGKELTI